MEESSITHHEGGTMFSGRAAVGIYRAIVIKPNRAYTPTAMLRAAGEITGKTFKRGQYALAIEALEDWLAENRPKVTETTEATAS